MKRLAQIVAAGILGLLPVLASAAVPQGFVEGQVNIHPRKLVLVSNEYGNTFFPGQRLVITVTGTVDVNFVRRSEETCFLFFCKTRRWIDHNFQDASVRPVRFRLEDEVGNPVQEFETQAGRAEINIPLAGTNTFNRRMRLVGMVADSPGLPVIDPGRSQGQFDVRIDVSTRARAQQVPTYLMQARPTAQVLKQAWVADPFLIEQNRSALSLALVELAKAAFPPSNTATAAAHRDLLDYAAEVAPQSGQVTAAMADMFLKQGKPQEAENVLVKQITDLNQKLAAGGTPELYVQLAAAHLSLAQTMEKARGYATADDLSAIWAQYGSAYEIATRYGAQAIASEALLGRAHSQRGRNTVASLKAAEDDFRRARDLSPRVFTGAPLSASQDGQQLLMLRSDVQLLLRWESMDPGAPAKIVADMGKAQAFSAQGVAPNGKVLVRAGDSVGWIDLAAQKPEFTNIGQYGRQLRGGVTNGRSAILFLAPEPSAQTHESWLLKENLQRMQVNIDGKPLGIVEMAADAERYLVVGAPAAPGPTPPQLPVELRQITGDADRMLRRVSVPATFDGIYRISPDGKRFAALLAQSTFGPSPPQTTRKLTVWDDGNAVTDVHAKTTPGFPIVYRPPGAPAITVPDDHVMRFEFSADSQQLFAATGDGSIVRMAIQANAPAQNLNLPAAARPKKPFDVYRLARVGSRHLVVEGADADGPYVQLVDVQGAQARLLRREGVLGFWQDAAGRIGSVDVFPAPVEVQVVRPESGAVGRVAHWNLEEGGAPLLLNGGRFACGPGADKVALRNLADDAEVIVPAPAVPAQELPPGMYAMAQKPRVLCVPQLAQDSWLLVVDQAGTLATAVPYQGAQVRTGDRMPALPPAFIDAERAAATRLKQPFMTPRWFFPRDGMSFSFGPGAPRADPFDPLAYDGFAFAMSMQGAVTAEAKAKGTKWVSMPYVMLQQAPLTLKYARLPVDSFAVKILPPPVDKLIYAQYTPQGQQFFWKPLGTDVAGKPIPLPSAGANVAASTRVIANPEGTRLMFVRSYSPQGGVSQGADVEQKLFSVTANDLVAIDCRACARRQVDTRTLLPEGEASGVSWGALQVDRGLNYLGVYTPEQALVHSITNNTIIASLPRKQMLWIGPEHALFVTGRMEYSQLRYAAPPK